ncbi:hypothetical protein SAMN05660816_00299 [Niastella yeongjuensis]|nr:hypothetical protein SAMN05660816_00299 [Niastella yeongjuensis]
MFIRFKQKKINMTNDKSFLKLNFINTSFLLHDINYIVVPKHMRKLTA